MKIVTHLRESESLQQAKAAPCAKRATLAKLVWPALSEGEGVGQAKRLTSLHCKAGLRLLIESVQIGMQPTPFSHQPKGKTTASSKFVACRKISRLNSSKLRRLRLRSLLLLRGRLRSASCASRHPAPLFCFVCVWDGLAAWVRSANSNQHPPQDKPGVQSWDPAQRKHACASWQGRPRNQHKHAQSNLEPATRADEPTRGQDGVTS